MPGRDGTGPMGMRAMKGQRAGYGNAGRCFCGRGWQRGCRSQSALTGRPGHLRNNQES